MPSVDPANESASDPAAGEWQRADHAAKHEGELPRYILPCDGPNVGPKHTPNSESAARTDQPTEPAADAAALRVGDVVRYTPPTTWCRDGIAIAQQQGDRLALVDTYWSGGETVVAPDSFEVLFNLSDYEEAPLGTWETFDPKDRECIRRHHGHRPLYLVRKGAAPSLSTQIANAEERVAGAEEAVRSAHRKLDYERSQLAALRARPLTPEGNPDR